jgi:hypothetical protein
MRSVEEIFGDDWYCPQSQEDVLISYAKSIEAAMTIRVLKNRMRKMGYYIETDGRFGKAEYIIKNHSAVEVSEAPPWLEDAAIVCVVSNGDFEAAGYCYSPDELAVFARPDTRPKRWLVMDKALAMKLSGFSP